MCVCVGSCAWVRPCGLMYAFRPAFYSCASKTRSPVPCSPSRITAHSLLLTSSIRAINKYIESTTLYHPLITLENRSVTQKRALWEATWCRQEAAAPSPILPFHQAASEISEEATHHFYGSVLGLKTILTKGRVI